MLTDPTQLQKMPEPLNNFIRCCHACQSEQTAEVLCQDCGPTRAFFSYELDGASQVPLTCEKCEQPVSKAGRARQNIPPQCFVCRSTDLGWRKRRSGEWLSEPTDEHSDEGPWVTGDFDADFEGSAGGDFRKLGSELGTDYRYSIQFNRFQLENIQMVDAPPLAREHNDRPAPLRFRNVSQALIYRPDTQGRVRVYRADLIDVRLHDWTKTIDEHERERQLSGRLQGKAYARIRVPSEEEIHASQDEANQRTERPIPEDEIKKNPVYPDEEADEPASPQPAEIDAAAHCNTCNLFVLAAVFLVLFLACRWQTAVLGVLVMALQCWWRSHRMSRSQNNWSNGAEIATGIVLIVLAVLVFLWAQQQDCMRDSVWWLAGMALLLLLTAVLRRCWPWLVISLLWVVMLLSLFCNSFSGNCVRPQSTSNPSTSTSVAGVPIPSLEDLNPLPSLQEAIDNVVNGVGQQLAIDQNAHVVQDQDSGRVSLDQALANPTEFFSCTPPSGRFQRDNRRPPYAITFSEAALFQSNEARLNEDRLREGADAHLRKLARLIATNPQVRVILTGHADRSGSPEYNLDLSWRRAQAVADWLITHGHLKPEQVDVRGAGDRYPIVNSPRLFQYNRRVDISVACQERKE